MSTSAVKAGRAYVELSVKDRMSQGLDAARARFMAWGSTLTVMGTAAIATSAGIFAALGGAVNAFESYGSSLNDLSNSTGVAVEDLSALQYAAKLNGISAAQLTTGLKGLIKFTGGVASGSKKAAQTLAELGISQEAFLKAGTVGKMNMVADALAGIGDGTARANKAMEIFGKGGLEMARLLGGGSEELKKLIAEAERLGAVMTTEEAQKADELGDSWDKLTTAGGGVARAIGGALADSLILVYSVLTEVAVATREFVKNNQWLVLSVAAAAIILAGLGAALVIAGLAGFVLAGIMAGLNGMIALASASWAALIAIKAAVIAVNSFLIATLSAEGIAALWATIQTWLLNAAMSVLAVVSAAAAAALAFLLTPIGLILVGLAALAVVLIGSAIYWAFFTEAGQAAMQTVASNMWALLGVAGQTARGVFDALLAGNWGLAGQILMSGLEVAVRQGLFYLMGSFEQFKADVLQVFASMITAIGNSLDALNKQATAAVNFVREKLGLDPIQGIPGLGGAASALKATGSAASKGIEANRQSNVDKLAQNLLKAQGELASLTAQATEERKAKGSDRREQLMNVLRGSMDGLSGPTGGTGSNLGTFNAAVAGMLSSSAPGVAERTAKATEKMEEHLSDLLDLADENGLVFGE